MGSKLDSVSYFLCDRIGSPAGRTLLPESTNVRNQPESGPCYGRAEWRGLLRLLDACRAERCGFTSGRRSLLRLVGCLPRRNGAAARAAGVRQASKEETAEHRADAADVMGIVASASGPEPPSRTRAGGGELAVRATAGAADDTLGVPTARMRMHRDHRTGRSSERRCPGCSTHHQQHEGHGRAGVRS